MNASFYLYLRYYMAFSVHVLSDNLIVTLSLGPRKDEEAGSSVTWGEVRDTTYPERSQFHGRGSGWSAQVQPTQGMASGKQLFM